MKNEKPTLIVSCVSRSPALPLPISYQESHLSWMSASSLPLWKPCQDSLRVVGRGYAAKRNWVSLLCFKAK